MCQMIRQRLCPLDKNKGNRNSFKYLEKIGLFSIVGYVCVKRISEPLVDKEENGFWKGSECID